MRRLVYAPTVKAFIKISTGQVVDISPYLVSGDIDRKVNQVSGATLVLRNPPVGGGAPGIINSPSENEAANLLFTEYTYPDKTVGPLFHPMDPIIIIMQRLQGYPVQVFTGFIDKSPYIQLYPGLCSIEASCTLKKLLYTQWDAALPFVQYFLNQYGWTLNSQSGIVNPAAELQTIKSQAGQLQGRFNDGSIGALLYAVLTNIADWDPNSIWIEALPPQIPAIVTKLYGDITSEVQQGETLFKGLISQILGATSQGTGSPSGGNTPGTLPANIDQSNWAQAILMGIGAPVSDCNIKAMEYWSQQEGVLSQNNPFGAAIGSPSTIADGVKATVQVLLQSNYAYIVAAFKANSGLKTIWQALNGATPGQGSSGNQCWCCSICGANYPGTLFNALNTPCSTASTANSPTSSGTGVPLAPHQGSTATIAGTSPGGKTGSSTSSPSSTVNQTKPFFPLPKTVAVGPSSWSQDQGVDISTVGAACGSAAPLYAVGAGTVTAHGLGGFGNDAPTLHLDTPIAGYSYVYYGHSGPTGAVAVGTHVTAGQQIGSVGCGIVGISTGPHLEIGFASNAAGQPVGSQSSGTMLSTLQAAYNGNFVDTGTASGTTGTGTGSGGGASSTAAAFSTFINLPSIFSSAEALAFTGKRSFIADSPLFPFVDQLCQASVRNFMSMPNGNFFAFFPDYFGLFGRKYYWEIHDIEIIEGRIDLSDDPLVTNVAVAGDVTQFHDTVDVFDLILTSGIFDIFDAYATGYVGTSSVQSGQTPSLADSAAATKNAKGSTAPKVLARGKADALAFLQRYGARPYVEEAPMIRSPIFELFLAFQKFMLLWSKQFVTTFELTFMPEVFPGGLVALPDHHLQLYVEEVTHSFDYQHGFTTTIAVSSPSRLNAGLKTTYPSSGTTLPTTPSIANTPTGVGNIGNRNS